MLSLLEAIRAVDLDAHQLTWILWRIELFDFEIDILFANASSVHKHSMKLVHSGNNVLLIFALYRPIWNHVKEAEFKEKILWKANGDSMTYKV